MTIALPGLAGLGTPELIIIVLVVLLLFGGKKLPEMARGTGRALRIFKAETKGLMEDDDDVPAGATQAQLPQQSPAPPPVVVQQPLQQTAQEPWPQPVVQQPAQQVPVEQPRTDSER